MQVSVLERVPSKGSGVATLMPLEDGDEGEAIRSAYKRQDRTSCWLACIGSTGGIEDYSANRLVGYYNDYQ